MGIKDKMKTYNFWISLVSALLLVARILGTKYGFTIDSGLVMDVTTAMCSVFVILGIISAPQKVVTKYLAEDKATESNNKTQDIAMAEEINLGGVADGQDNENAIEDIIEENDLEPVLNGKEECDAEEDITTQQQNTQNTQPDQVIEPEQNKEDATIGNLEALDKNELIKVILSMNK